MGTTCGCCSLGDKENITKSEVIQAKIQDVIKRWKGVPDYKRIFNRPFKEVYTICNLHEPVRVHHDDRVDTVARIMTENKVRAAVVDKPSELPTILEDATNAMQYECVLIDFNDINHAINIYEGDRPVSAIRKMHVGDIANLSGKNVTVTCTENQPVGEILSLMTRRESRRAVIYDEDARIKGIFHLGDALTLFKHCEATMELLSMIDVSWVPRQENIVANPTRNVAWALLTMLEYNHSSMPVVANDEEKILGVVGIRDLELLLGDMRNGDRLLTASVTDLIAIRGYAKPLSVPKDSDLDVVVQTFIDTSRARLLLLDKHDRPAGSVSSSSIVWMIWPILAARIEEDVTR